MAGNTESAIITITADRSGPGILAGIKTSGAFSGPDIERRFFSYDTEPPEDIPPEVFWGKILGDISAALQRDM
jgi:hypothetical protein